MQPTGTRRTSYLSSARSSSHPAAVSRKRRCVIHLRLFCACAKTQKIHSCVSPNSLEDLGRFLYRSPPELCLLCPPDSSATLSAICTGTIRNFMGHLHRDPPNLVSHPEPSRTWPFETSSGICIGTLRNFVCYLRPNPPASHQSSTPEPSGTSRAICTGALWNPLEPHQLISHLHRNRPKPHQQSAPESSGTLRNLLRNLMLQLHRIAPELFWAKDPIASFAVGEKQKEAYMVGCEFQRPDKEKKEMTDNLQETGLSTVQEFGHAWE